MLTVLEKSPEKIGAFFHLRNKIDVLISSQSLLFTIFTRRFIV